VTPRARLALVAAAVAVLVIAFLAFSGSDDDDTTSSTIPTTATAPAPATESTPSATDTTATTPTATTPAAPAVPVVRVVDGKPQGGVQRLEFSKGDRVRFTVRSDVADEIHVHGYDLAKDVAAGGSVSFDFPASIDGRFEVELESRAEQIAELEVNP
jgi:FtsP/CotA-like multicopper oxidase with cupredoxin domain